MSRIDHSGWIRLALWPTLAVIALAIPAWLVATLAEAGVVVLGGVIGAVPGLIAALRFRAWRRAGAPLTLGRMLLWEAGKWILTAVLFAAVFVGYRGVPAVWLFGGFIVAQLAHMTALARMETPGNQHGRRHSDQL